jgi:hypothetical protein
MEGGEGAPTQACHSGRACLTLFLTRTRTRTLTRTLTLTRTRTLTLTMGRHRGGGGLGGVEAMDPPGVNPVVARVLHAQIGSVQTRTKSMLANARDPTNKTLFSDMPLKRHFGKRSDHENDMRH